MKIPLPSVEEQKNILDIYNKNKDLSKNQTGEVSEKSDYIEDFLKFSLGIDEIKVKKTANLLMLTRFKTLNIWSVDNIVRKNTFDSNLFKLTCLEDQPTLVKEVFRGKSPKYKEQTGSKILNQKCIRFNAIEVKHAKSVDSNWLNKVDSMFLTRENDILINSTGDGTIGRASIVSKEHEGLLYDSHIILLRLNTEQINPLFFVYFNNSKLGQKQIENIKSAKSTKQTELGVGNLLKLQFPLPDIDIQREIVLEIKNLETQIEDLKIKSVKNSNSAIIEFEEAIFIK